MDKQQKLMDDISKITTEIRENHPELTKYLDEMPVDNQEGLQGYYESLKSILEKYDDSQAKKD